MIENRCLMSNIGLCTQIQTCTHIIPHTCSTTHEYKFTKYTRHTILQSDFPPHSVTLTFTHHDEYVPQFCQ